MFGVVQLMCATCASRVIDVTHLTTAVFLLLIHVTVTVNMHVGTVMLIVALCCR